MAPEAVRHALRGMGMDVAAWLDGLGLGQYEPAFRDNAVDGDVLPLLTADDLKELGVLAVGHRRKLLDAIAALRQPDVAAPPPAVPEAPGERRQVSVLFADLAGYTALSRELDPEEVHALLDRFFARVDRVVEEHGGRIDKHIGDCVMAVFGAPVAHGNDAERAVRAALAMRDGMPGLSAEVGREIGIHVGVAGGQVVAAGTGSSGHREYTVTGDSVNLASRLSGLARTGEVLAADAVRHALGGRLVCEELEALEVKGFAEPVRAWRVLDVLAGDAPTDRGPLVGRRAELERFRAALGDLRGDGHGSAVHVRGEAGIGKTRLVEEFQREAQDAGLAGHAGLVLDFGAGTGRSAVRALALGLLEPDGPEAPAARAHPEDALFLDDLLERPRPPELQPLHDAIDPTARARARERTLARLVERAAAARPRLLLVEDVHWADAPTLGLLAVLAAACRRCPCVLVTTSRIEGDPLGPAWWAAVGGPPVAIDLAPLAPAEARALAAPLLAANAAAAERCVERAGGNPLFLEQLLRHAAEGLDAAVPGSVQSLVQARLDRLHAAEKATLQAASILGQRFELNALRAVLDDIGPATVGLVDQALLRPTEGGLMFAHALVRDAVYDGMLRSRRRELHRRAAAWYDGRDASLRAEHLDRAGDPDAAAAYLAAARGLLAAQRHEQALPLAERGRELARDPGVRFALACLGADLLHDLGRMPAALAAYESALGEAPGEVERCRALIGRAAVKRVTDDLDGAFADLAAAETLAVAQDLVVERARIHFLRGNLCFPRGDIAGCLREHGRSLELARAAGAVEQEAAALGGLGDAEYVQGRMLSARDAFARCVALCQERGLGRIEVANRPMLAFTRWLSGDSREALAEAEAAIAAAARIGHLRGEMIARHAAYFCCHSLTRWEAAAAHAERALVLAQQLLARRFEAEALAFRAELHGVAGRGAEARAAAGEALAISRETGMAFLGPVILGVLALVTEEAAAVSAIMAEADALLAAGSVSHNHFLYRRAAIEACLRRGDRGRAEREAAALAAYAEREPSPWSEFVIARGRALAACGRGADDPATVAELRRLRAEAQARGFLDAMAAIDAALAGARSAGQG